MIISHVQPEAVDSVWMQLRPMIQKALRTGQGDQTTEGYLLAGIKSGNLLLWAVHDGKIYAVMILDILQHPAKKVLFVVLIAGEQREKWADKLENSLVEFSRIIGAESIEASCRAGLAKYLGKRGWKQKAVIMEYTQ